MNRLFIFFLAILFFSCSSQKDAVLNRAFHNLAAHYNGYYYAKEEVTKVEKAYQKALTDDYNKILRLFPKLDSAQAKGFEKELQEAIKMASLAIQYHQNSKWVDDSYILVGRARLYQLDWGNAIQTFKFVNTKTKDPEARHEAIIWLIRTFTEHKEYNNARAAIDFLLKQKLSDTHYKMLLLEIAYLAQTENNLDEMVRSLAIAAPMLKKKSDRPGRIYFIIGQVYQKLGFESEAYNYYRKCLGTHPEYEVDFYARLYQAQVAEISKSKSIASARKSYNRLLKDAKNKDFQDKIYFEMGVFELKQKNEKEGIAYLQQSIRLGNNALVDGEAFLKLAEHYYQKRKYENAQAYYDSASKVLPKDYENLAAINKRKNILDEFVKHLSTLRLQDSLLVLAKMDTASLRKKIEADIEKNKKPIVVSKKKKRNRIDIAANDNPIFNTNESETENTSWYFGSATAVAGGQSEFIRVWGEFPLEDNWRRSQRSTTRTSITNNTNEELSTPTKEETAPTVAINKADATFKELLTILPTTTEKEAEALKKIEDALYNLGDLYYLQLNETENALSEYEKLIQRFPQSNYEAEVLYRITLICKETNKEKSDQAAQALLNKHPESAWAKLLLNPNYLTEASKAAVKQKKIYEEAYQLWQSNQLDSASLLVNQAHALGKTNFSPYLDLLDILIIGSKKENELYVKGLEKFIADNPEHALSAYAKTLLDKVKSLQKNQNPDNNAIIYKRNDGSLHHFVIYFKKDENLETSLKKAVPDFNTTYFSNQTFESYFQSIGEDQSLLIVGTFDNKEKAAQYLNLFNDKLAAMSALKRFNFSNFVINAENLLSLTRTQKLNEYLVFYTRYYQTENP
ncbi:MAG: tetratricopeptide repeat protein [Cyclobacteriaceae bacterium]|nr:tetratricopeptide repeat protein [Cyclobacteriaceae bacterium]